MTSQETSDNKGDILVVDDVLTNLRLISQTLSAEGYRVRPARSGSLALTMVQASLPDLILLDVMMPEMDGYEVCRHLKADPLTRDIPVIFLSAKDDKDAKLKGFQLGGIDYITKPFYHEEVLARIDLHLTLRNLQKQIMQSNRELDLLQKLAVSFNQMHERKEAVWLGVRNIVELLNAQCGWLVLSDRTGETHLEAHHGLSNTELAWVNQQAVANTPVSLAAPEILPAANCLGSAESNGAYLVRAPLVIGSRSWGTLNIVTPFVSSLEKEGFRLLNTISSQYSQTIERVMLFDEVQELAKTDPLTGLFNRRFFMEIGRREVEKCRRYQRPISLFMIDIDFFKAINDTYGHPSGDRALTQISAACRDNLRQVDITCRYGGEEFACLLPETSWANAYQTAERLRGSIEKLPIHANGEPVYLTISIGVSSNLQTDITLEEMIEQADQGLYLAKQNGRNQVRMFPEQS